MRFCLKKNNLTFGDCFVYLNFFWGGGWRTFTLLQKMKQYLQEASSEVSPLFGTVTNDTQYIDFDTYRAEHTTFNFNKYEY